MQNLEEVEFFNVARYRCSEVANDIPVNACTANISEHVSRAATRIEGAKKWYDDAIGEWLR